MEINYNAYENTKVNDFCEIQTNAMLIKICIVLQKKEAKSGINSESHVFFSA